MQLQRSPNHWSCLPTAFAMVLDVKVHDFIRQIGHDGSEIVWDLPEPACRRGFHIQECTDVLDRLWFSCTPFEVFPRHAPMYDFPRFIVFFGGGEKSAFERFTKIINRGRGVITGQSNVGHAVAYNHGIIYDPNGAWYKYSRQECEAHNFIGICAWEIHRIAIP